MPTLTGFKQDRAGKIIDKDPYAILDYTLDFVDWMPAGDSITSATVTAETIAGDSSALTIDSTGVTANTVTANISAGTAGNTYNIEYKIVTTNGLRDSRNFRIKIIERQA
jgi:hypothetical protein